MPPQGEARPNSQIFRDLAQRLGFGEACFQDSDEAMCRQAFGREVDFNTLLAQGFVSLPVPEAPFAKGGFPTPSGKCTFFSEALVRLGQELQATVQSGERPILTCSALKPV